MLYSDSLREVMQNGLNESFWDGLGVEIGPCAKFRAQNAFLGDRKKLWGLDVRGLFTTQDFGNQILVRPNLDAMSVQEALAHSIRILVAQAVFPAHQWPK